MSKGRNYSPAQQRAAWMNPQHPVGAKVQTHNAAQGGAKSSGTSTPAAPVNSTPAAVPAAGLHSTGSTNGK